MRNTVICALLAMACEGPDQLGSHVEALSTVPGCDVSNHQGTINWGSVAGQGARFAIAKTSEGLSFLDPYWSGNYSGAKAAGLYAGGYHFARPDRSGGRAQADYFVDHVGWVNDGRTLPPMLDIEWPWSGSGAPYPCYGLSTSQMRQWIRDFVDEVKARTGREAMIYTNRNWWDPCTGSSTDFSANPLITASYTSSPGQLPAGWSNWTFWQFADQGRFPGDQDVFNGDEAALAAFAAGAGGIAPQAFRRRAVGGAPIGQVCGRASDAVYCAVLDKQGNMTPVQGPPLADSGSWNEAKYYSTIQFADVNGDGRADVCARGYSKILCWLAGGAGFPTEISGPALGDPNGWGDPKYYSTIQFADVSGDGRADVCGRAGDGFYCWLSDGAGFPTQIAGPALSDANGWGDPKYYGTIQLVDVNGDGKADVCARGAAGLGCWLADGAGFPTPIAGPALSDANGWGDRKYYATIQFPDVNGDGKADVCGRAGDGIACWLADGAGFPTQIVGPPLSDAQGWGDAKYYSTIQFADVNGDGKADVCGRGAAGLGCWLSDGAGFPTQIAGPPLSDAQGWGEARYYSTLRIDDIDGDGKADVCGRGAAGFGCWLSDGAGFPTPITGPAWSDANGWSAPQYYETLFLLGTPVPLGSNPDGGAGSGGSGGGPGMNPGEMTGCACSLGSSEAAPRGWLLVALLSAVRFHRNGCRRNKRRA